MEIEEVMLPPSPWHTPWAVEGKIMGGSTSNHEQMEYICKTLRRIEALLERLVEREMRVEG